MYDGWEGNVGYSTAGGLSCNTKFKSFTREESKAYYDDEVEHHHTQLL
jgi:hypothetical protein